MHVEYACRVCMWSMHVGYACKVGLTYKVCCKWNVIGCAIFWVTVMLDKVVVSVIVHHMCIGVTVSRMIDVCYSDYCSLGVRCPDGWWPSCSGGHRW